MRRYCGIQLSLITLPTIEDVIILRNIIPKTDELSIVQRVAMHFFTINYIYNGISIDTKHGRVGHILCWHTLWYDRCPSLEGITLLFRICRLDNRRVIQQSRALALSVNNPRHGIAIAFPLGSKRHVCCRDVFWNLHIPSSKRKAFLLRVGRSRQCRVIVLLDNEIFFTVVKDERHRILIDCILSCIGSILSRHGLRYFRRPSGKTITSLCRNCRDVENILIGIVHLGALTFNHPRHFIVVTLPLCREGHILSWYRLWHLRFPSQESKTFLSEVCWRSQRCVILKVCQHLIFLTIILHECHGVLSNSKRSCQFCITRWNIYIGVVS